MKLEHLVNHTPETWAVNKDCLDCQNLETLLEMKRREKEKKVEK